jgi:hypothetical protein
LGGEQQLGGGRGGHQSKGFSQSFEQIVLNLYSQHDLALVEANAPPNRLRAGCGL